MTVRNAILFSVVVGAILRLGVLLLFAGDPTKVSQPDSVQYRQLGFELAKTGRFQRQIESGELVPEIFRTPGYPALVAVVRLFAGEARFPLLFLQCLMGVACVALTAWLGARLGGPWTGLLAGLLLACDPAAIHLDNLILSESPYAFVLLGSIACTFLAAGSNRRAVAWALAGGALSGLAALVRPFGLLMFVVVAPGILLATGSPMKRRLLLAALWSLAHLLPVGLWTVRNGVRSGSWTFTTVSSYNLLVFQAATVRAGEEGMTCNDAGAALLARVQAAHPGAHWCGPELPRAAREEAMRWIRSAPARLVLETPRILRRLYLGEAPPFYEDALSSGGGSASRGGIARILFLGWVLAQWAVLALVLAAGVHGVVSLARTDRPSEAALLAGCMLYPFLLLLGACSAYYRFRAPFDPYLAIAAAAGLHAATRAALRRFRTLQTT